MTKDIRRLVFVGDSLTDGAAWTDWVMSTLAENGYPGIAMNDAAVAGNKVGQVKTRLDKDVLALKPDLVILHIGTNDRVAAELARTGRGDAHGAEHGQGAPGRFV